MDCYLFISSKDKFVFPKRNGIKAAIKARIGGGSRNLFSF